MRNSFIGSIVIPMLMMGFSLQASAQTYGTPGYAPGAWKPDELPKDLAKPKPYDAHSLTGVWVILTGKDAGPEKHSLTNLPHGVLVDPTKAPFQPPAMTPEGQAKYDAAKPQYGPRGVAPGLGNDPVSTCDPLGYPHVLWAANQRPFEILMLSDRVVEHFQYHDTWRTIWTDGRSLPKDPDPAWYGYSVGKWDGNTFVVESNGYDDRTWIDHFASPHSDQMHLEERYRRVDAESLELTMTLTDPKTYLKPWVSDKFTFKNPKQAIYEEICAPSEESLFNDRIRDAAIGKAKP